MERKVERGMLRLEPARPIGYSLPVHDGILRRGSLEWFIISVADDLPVVFLGVFVI